MAEPRPTRPLDAVLVSFRDPGDPMIEHEHRCFSATTGLAEIEVLSAVAGDLGERALRADLVLCGGSGTHGVNEREPWLKRALDLLLEVAARGIPAWASCFAFQGLAVALGGEVIRDDRRKRIGAQPVRLTAEGVRDPLFGGFPERFSAQFGHHDHVERAPSGVTVLATGDAGDCLCFRVRGSQFWGAQFHPELDKRTTWDRWSHYRALYAGHDGPAIDRHLREAPDTPEVKGVLAAVTRLAEDHRARA